MTQFTTEETRKLKENASVAALEWAWTFFVAEEQCSPAQLRELAIGASHEELRFYRRSGRSSAEAVSEFQRLYLSLFVQAFEQAYAAMVEGAFRIQAGLSAGERFSEWRRYTRLRLRDLVT